MGADLGLQKTNKAQTQARDPTLHRATLLAPATQDTQSEATNFADEGKSRMEVAHSVTPGQVQKKTWHSQEGKSLRYEAKI